MTDPGGIDRLAHAKDPTMVDAGGAPLVAARAEGAWLWTTNGDRYVDWVMGHGAVLLGHGHPAVCAAVAAQLADGTIFPTHHALELEAAAAIHAAVPGAERVLFGKNGSDACTAAVRIARAATGRLGVLHSGYHGFHDWCAVLDPRARGLPPALAALIHTLPFGDSDALAAVLASDAHRIAALILEPTRTETPPAGYLQTAAALCRQHGVVLIFDEMVTGFRLARGGAQEHYGVRADLVCIGKALTNGMPLAAVCGAPALLEHATEIGYGMTMRGEALALAAAAASLRCYEREPVAAHVAAVGARMRDGFASLCAARGVDGQLAGEPSMLTLALPQGWSDRFLAVCRARGVLSRGHLLPSLAHGDEAIERTLAAFAAALDACCRAG